MALTARATEQLIERLGGAVPSRAVGPSQPLRA
jgi:hypothetical protein